MSELEELTKQIEELRLNMINIQVGKSYTHPEVIAASQELDDVLDKYQVMQMKLKKADEIATMIDYKKGAHTVYDIKYHVVWVTKYRKKILHKVIGRRLRELLRQGCETIGVTIVQGNIDKDHVHMLISCPTNIAPSRIVQYLKGRSSNLLQDEFPEIKKKYWGQNLWAVGYFCATAGSGTEETIKAYIEDQDKNSVKEIFKIEDK